MAAKLVKRSALHWVSELAATWGKRKVDQKAGWLVEKMDQQWEGKMAALMAEMMVEWWAGPKAD